MILIGGTNLTVEELPMSDIIEYQIESGKKLEIKLRTIGRTSDCFGIYLHESLRSEVTITDEIMDKLKFFNDDNQLISYLMGEPDDEETTFLEEDLEVELPDFGVPKSRQNQEDEELEDELSEFEADSEDIFGEKEEEIKDIFDEDFEDTSELESELEEIEESEGIFEGKSTEDIFDEEVKVEDIVEENNDVEELEKDIEVSDSKEKEEVPYYEQLEEVDTELPDVFLQIPNLGDDTDSLKLQLETKDRIIKQKEGMIKELEQEREEIYKLQELQIKEIQEVYNKKMEEVQKIIADLEKRVKGPQLDDESLEFLKFLNYSKNYRAALREGFSEMERMKLGRLNSKYYILGAGSGDSLYSMLRNVKSYIEKNNSAIVVDFSNDPFLSTAFAKHIKRVNGKKIYSIDLANSDTNLLEMFTSFSKTKVLFSNLYNDIGLLNLNWVEILKKVDEYAGGKPVIFLFNNINSFAVRYTLSKLATIGTLYVFVKCSPLILTTLYGDINFIPEDRVNIVAMEYIDVVKNVLNVISTKYQVIPFAKEVDWKKLLR